MKKLLAASAAVELGAGVGLLWVPSAMATLLIGAKLEGPAAVTVARVGGAGLLALAVACWRARGDAQSSAAQGVVSAMFIYDVAAAAVLGYAGVGYSLNGVALWPAVVLHAVMALWCVAFLRNGRRPTAAER